LEDAAHGPGLAEALAEAFPALLAHRAGPAEFGLGAAPEVLDNPGTRPVERVLRPLAVVGHGAGMVTGAMAAPCVVGVAMGGPNLPGGGLAENSNPPL